MKFTMKAIGDSRERQRALEKKWPSSYADGLETEAARFREALAVAVETLADVDNLLTVPAAEYVLAISDAFKSIDAGRRDIEAILRDEK